MVQIRIGFIGDSITHGNGAGPAEDYPAVLAATTGLTVVNAGVPGEVTADGRERLPALLDRLRPDLLLLCHGGNDLLRKLGPDSIRRNLGAMVDMAHARGIPVMLIGVPQPGLFMLKSAEVYGDIAASYGLPYDGSTLPDIYSDRQLKSDQIHPNAAGYRRLAEAVPDLADSPSGGLKAADYPQLRHVVSMKPTAAPGIRTWQEFLNAGDAVSEEQLADRQRPLQPGDAGERCAFAATGRAEQRQEFTVLDIDVEAIDRTDLIKGFGQTFDGDACHVRFPIP